MTKCGKSFMPENVRQVTLDGDTLIIKTDKLPEGYVPCFYCRVDDKEIDITEYVYEENFSTEE